jgi:hypothetical protein
MDTLLKWIVAAFALVGLVMLWSYHEDLEQGRELELNRRWAELRGLRPESRGDAVATAEGKDE